MSAMIQVLMDWDQHLSEMIPDLVVLEVILR